MDFWLKLFDPTGFPARWHCGSGWAETPWLGWLHILSDLGVWTAYFAIPIALAYFILRKKDLPFRLIFLLFGAFILLCGLTHLMDAVIFWWPIYRFAGVLKAVTAMVSWGTVFALIHVTPQVLSMRSPDELRREIAARGAAESELQRVNAELERRVNERTTELSKAVSDLAAERELLRTTLRSIGDGVIITDTQGRIAFVNEVAEGLTACRAEDAMEKPLTEVFHIVHEDTRAPMENPAAHALLEGSGIRRASQTLLIAKDGVERVIDESAAPIRGVRGKTVGSVIVFRDITERRRANRVLRESEARKTAMFETALDCIISVDHAGKVLEFNAAAERTFGYGREEARGKDLSELIHTGADPMLNRRLELTATRTGGQTFPIEFTMTRIPLDGPPTFTAFLRDITQRREFEETLQESQRFLRSSLDALTGCIAVLDNQGIILEVNETWRRFAQENQFVESAFGIGGDYLRACESGIPNASDGRAVAFAIREVMSGKRDVSEHEYGFHLPQQQRWFIMRATRFQSPGPMRIVVSHENITERKRLEIELRKTAADLSQADRRKSEFLAILAHELRNPLAPIRNALTMIRVSEQNAAAVQGATAVMERQVGQMVRLVDDLLDVSRISEGKIELRPDTVELRSIIEQAVETSRPQFEAARQELKVDLPATPIWLKADAVRLAQVFSNLLNNACKYSERGGQISLTANSNGRDAEIRVRDEGVGIPTDMLPQIFEMFTQVDQSLERAQGGLGIGLTLVKRLVEMHHGTVSAQSEGPGRGSEFVVRLPVLQGEVERGAPAAPVPLPTAKVVKRRILVVDDNRDAAITLAMLLKVTGNETKTAHDGLTAVETAESFRPDVVILDIGLPKLNGYDAAKRIREQPWGQSLVLIALTGWGQDEDRRRSSEAGFNQHLVKPVDHATLVQLINTLHPATN